jgi:hypothetical protein
VCNSIWRSTGVNDLNASIIESMDRLNQHTEPKMFGSTKESYGDFCCVLWCSNQRGNDKINILHMDSIMEALRSFTPVLRQMELQVCNHEKLYLFNCSKCNELLKVNFNFSKESYGDFCCVLWCSNQRGNDKINRWKRSYYIFPMDPKQASVWLKITCNTHFQILWYKIEFDWNIS